MFTTKEYKKVKPYYGPSDTLSNMNLCSFVFKDIEFDSVERAYQFMKAEHAKDQEIMNLILDAPSAVKAKSLSYKIKGLDSVSWSFDRNKIMYDLILHKYMQNPIHRRVLMSTKGSLLAEANKDDMYWGTGLDIKNYLNHSPSLWRGKNMAGKISTLIRDLLLERGWEHK